MEICVLRRREAWGDVIGEDGAEGVSEFVVIPGCKVAVSYAAHMGIGPPIGEAPTHTGIH